METFSLFPSYTLGASIFLISKTAFPQTANRFSQGSAAGSSGCLHSSRVLCTMEYFLQGFLRQAGGQVIGQLYEHGTDV